MEQKKQKVVVIGAGIMGMASAANLAEAGYEVTVLEKAGIAGAASGANLGQISLMDRMSSWEMPLAKRTAQIYRKMMERFPQIEYNPEGGCYLIEEEPEFKAAKDLMEEAVKWEVPCHLYTTEEDIHRILPLASDMVKGVLYVEGEGLMNPLQVVTAYSILARENGAVIYEYTPVTGFVMEEGIVKAVKTERNEYPCDYVVCASGAWTREMGVMLGQPVELEWRKGSAFISEPLPQRIYTGQVSGHQFLSGKEEAFQDEAVTQVITVGCSQNMEGTVSIAQCTEMADVNDTDISLEGMSQVAAEFLKRFPEAADMDIIRIWAGVTPLSPDGYPFFGWHAKAKNALIAAGFKGAFTTGPAAAEEVVRVLQGCGTMDRTHMDPCR